MNLEELLKRNYNSLVDRNCKVKVVQYLKETESVSDKDILFVKRLTKVGTNILESFPEALEGLEKKLFDFHLEGVELARKEKKENDDNLIKIEGHLCAHAGNVAEVISNYEEAYKLYLSSAEVLKDIEPHYALFSLNNARKIAKKMFSKTKDAIWTERWYEIEIKTASLQKEAGKKAEAFSFAGKAANKTYKMRRDPVWAKRWYEAKVKSGDISCDNLNKAYSYCKAGKAAYTLFMIEHGESWRKLAMENYEKALYYAELLDEENKTRVLIRIKTDLT